MIMRHATFTCLEILVISMPVLLERERLERLQRECQQLEANCQRLMRERETLLQQLRLLQEQIGMPWELG